MHLVLKYELHPGLCKNRKGAFLHDHNNLIDHINDRLNRSIIVLPGQSTIVIKSVQEDTNNSLTQVPDAEEMDENIYWLVVVGGIEHKLLLQVKKSSITCHFLIICKFACLTSIVFLSEMIYLLSLYTLLPEFKTSRN